MKKALALIVFALLLEGAVLLQLATPPIPPVAEDAAMVAQVRPPAGGPARPALPCRDGAKRC